MTPQDFVQKWRQVELKERSAYTQHFLDLCALLGHPTPAEADPKGAWFTFEAGASKTGGGQGWADVWKKGYFAWEYKGKHADLDKAYQQLLQYRESLQNPPLLVVCDIETHRHPHQLHQHGQAGADHVTLDDLLHAGEGLHTLRSHLHRPGALSRRADRRAGHRGGRRGAVRPAWPTTCASGATSRTQIAHFLIRLLFCLFAEDIDLLPRRPVHPPGRARRASNPAMLRPPVAPAFPGHGRRAAASASDDDPLLRRRAVRRRPGA